MNLKDHWLSILILLLCIIAVAASFYRFVIRQDYTVEYEVACDQATQHCFSGTDPDTSEAYFYAKMHKYAPDVQAECGADVTDCEAANSCAPTDTHCSITYCSDSSKLENETCAAKTSTPDVKVAPTAATNTEQTL